MSDRTWRQGEGEGEARVCTYADDDDDYDDDDDIIVIVEADGRTNRQFRPGFRWNRLILKHARKSPGLLNLPPCSRRWWSIATLSTPHAESPHVVHGTQKRRFVFVGKLFTSHIVGYYYAVGFFFFFVLYLQFFLPRTNAVVTWHIFFSESWVIRKKKKNVLFSTSFERIKMLNIFFVFFFFAVVYV